MPFSSRPSLVRTQTCLLLVSGPLPQTFTHGEYMSCGGASAAWAGAAGAAGAAAGALGAAFGAAGFVGFGCCANAGVAATMAAARNPAANEAVSARLRGRADAIQ